MNKTNERDIFQFYLAHQKLIVVFLIFCSEVNFILKDIFIIAN